jgi:cation transport ATPase
VTEAGVKPRVVFGRDQVRIEDPRLFDKGDSALARRFVRRVLALPEVRSVALQPAENAASVGFAITEQEREPFLARLITAVRAGTEIDEAVLPFWPADAATTLRRYGPVVSTIELLSIRRGRLHLRHPAIAADAVFARRVEDALRALPGVREATATRSSGKLWVAFDPGAIKAEDILRAAEIPAEPAAAQLPAVHEKPVDFRLANTSVGLATVGELAVPLATPLCAGLLVVTNLGMLRDAAGQIRRGKLGTPVWTTALLACSIASGQVLAYALTDWSFRYWTRRWRREAAAESRVLYQDTVPVPAQVRFKTADGSEILTPVQRVQPGQSVYAGAGEILPVDGRVVSGAALVHETPVSGARAAIRKVPGDEVYAGSTVIEGRIGVEVLSIGADTRAAHISRAVFRAATSLPDHPALQRTAFALTDRTVTPTLATAGVGLVVGDLFTVGAILHQDWLSGAELAVPLETLRGIRLAASRGAVVRSPDALQRLAQSRFVVLEDQPALHRYQMALHGIRSTLPDTDNLLGHVAGAGLYLGDERAAALAQACQERGLVVRQPELVALEPEAIVVRIGKHRLVLRGGIDPAEETQHLLVEVDGREVAWFEFRRTLRRQAAEAVSRLRAAGFQVFLASARPEAEAAELAAGLGIAQSSGDLATEQQVRFLRGLRKRGIRATWVGKDSAHPAIREAAQVSVSLGGGLRDEEWADIVIPGNWLDPLADVAALSGENAARIRQLCRGATAPNLLCIVGAFAGLLNGITAGILANIAVLNVYRAAAASLQSTPLKSGRAGRITLP